MKKQYVKPELYFENFELSANIATLCGNKVGHTDTTCYYEITGGERIFNGGECNVDAISPDGKDTYCYHNPSDLNRLFAS